MFELMVSAVLIYDEPVSEMLQKELVFYEYVSTVFSFDIVLFDV